jgi:dipeptidyl aminopeptidase/acylaminoacyl peptidase
MQGVSGALLYGCPTAGGSLADFFDAAGAARPGLQGLQAALAWTAGDYVLVRDAGGALEVVSPAGAAMAVSGLPAGAHLAYRTHATSFRVALHDDSAGADELWEIDQVTGVAAMAGTYASAPAYSGLGWEVMDSDGSLYGRAYVGVNEVILER